MISRGPPSKWFPSSIFLKRDSWDLYVCAYDPFGWWWRWKSISIPERSDALPFSYILKETCDRLSLKGAGMSHTGSRLCASVISKLADVCITSSPHLTHQHAGANPNICRRRRRRREINVKTQNFVHFAHYFPPFPSAIRIYWISKWHSRLNVMCRGRSRPEKQNRTTTGQTLGQSR
jgi:hypothetical protein